MEEPVKQPEEEYTEEPMEEQPEEETSSSDDFGDEIPAEESTPAPTQEEAPAPAAPPSGNRMGGTVKWFNRKKGYGFVQGEDGQDYFVHFTAVPKGVFLNENDRVTFDPAKGDKGNQAQNVAMA